MARRVQKFTISSITLDVVAAFTPPHCDTGPQHHTMQGPVHASQLQYVKNRRVIAKGSAYTLQRCLQHQKLEARPLLENEPYAHLQ
jgi:hypothetical protein